MNQWYESKRKPWTPETRQGAENKLNQRHGRGEGEAPSALLMEGATRAPLINIKVKRVLRQNPPLPLPEYHSEHAAGMDLMADLEKPILIEPGQRTKIPTGLSVQIPEGFEAQIRPRSGLAIKRGLTLLNTPGTIDADYRGEIEIILINLGEEAVKINHGDRIAQMVISPVVRAQWVEVAELSATSRSGGGFGSTG